MEGKREAVFFFWLQSYRDIGFFCIHGHDSQQPRGVERQLCGGSTWMAEALLVVAPACPLPSLGWRWIPHMGQCSPWVSAPAPGCQAQSCSSTLPISCCCSSVAQSCLTLYYPTNCSMPGLPVLHYLTEFTQTHVHWVDDAIQPFHPPLPPCPLALNLSQPQGLFQWVKTLYQVALY